MISFENWHKKIVDVSDKAIATLSNMSITPNSVVVFDIDDTLIHISGKCIEPIRKVFDYTKEIGLIPIIITNRSGTPDIVNYTKNQLSECCLVGYRSLYFREPSKPDNPYRYKEISRKSIHEKGMTVVMSIGDQLWDIGKYGGVGYIVPILRLNQ